MFLCVNYDAACGVVKCLLSECIPLVFPEIREANHSSHILPLSEQPSRSLPLSEQPSRSLLLSIHGPLHPQSARRPQRLFLRPEMTHVRGVTCNTHINMRHMSQRRGDEAHRRLHTVGEGGAGTTAGCFNAACARVTQCAMTVDFNQVNKKRQPAREGGHTTTASAAARAPACACSPVKRRTGA